MAGGTRERHRVEATAEELEALEVIRDLLADVVPADNLVLRGVQSYCSVLYTDNNRKPICRLYLRGADKSVGIADANKEFAWHSIDSTEDLRRYKDEFAAVALHWASGGAASADDGAAGEDVAEAPAPAPAPAAPEPAAVPTPAPVAAPVASAPAAPVPNSGRANDLAGLRMLHRQLVALEDAKAKHAKAVASVNAEQARPFTSVASFDSANRETYIAAKAGEEPEEPTGLFGKKKYREAYDAFLQRRREAEASYDAAFAQKRAQVQAEEEAQRRKSVDALAAIAASAKGEVDKADEIARANDFLGGRLKNVSAVSELINIIEERRADSLTDATDVYYLDQHRRELENLQRRQNEMTKDALAAAREAQASAENAEYYAEQSADSADAARSSVNDLIDEINRFSDSINEALKEAYKGQDLAEDAQARADEAYRLADQAMDAARDAQYDAQQARYNR